jgi:undecaprenyl-diphosphatase
VDILKAVILGILQGLTEFLPVSSSAHLVIVPWAFGWEPFGLAFDVSLHLGTLIAVFIYFRNELLAMITGVLRSWRTLLRGKVPHDEMGRLGIYIALASIPGAIAGLLFESKLDDFFHKDPISGTAIVLLGAVLALMGILLGIADRYSRTLQSRDIRHISFAIALTIGVAQMFAIFPGVSRSGSTITAGLFSGLSRPAAARFSFLLGVPLILGAGLKAMADLARDGIPAGERGVFIAGFITAAIVGYLAVAGLIRYLQRHSTDIFVVYRVLLGISLIVLVAAGFRG